MGTWMQIALSRSVVRRAATVSAVVGTILFLINHGDTLIWGDLDALHLLKFCLTYIVPYMVSTYASTSAILELKNRRNTET